MPSSEELNCAADTRTEAEIEMDRLWHENDMLTKAGVIEVAVRNPSVMEYMRHWEGRAEKAEAALAHPAPTAADTPYDPTTQPYDEPFRHVAADTGGLVELREYADACFASCYPPVDAVVQAILAERERAEQQLAAARADAATAWDKCEERRLAQEDAERRASSLEMLVDNAAAAIADLAAAREQIAELERDLRTKAAIVDQFRDRVAATEASLSSAHETIRAKDEELSKIQDMARDWEGLSISELADDIDEVATAALTLAKEMPDGQ